MKRILPLIIILLTVFLGCTGKIMQTEALSTAEDVVALQRGKLASITDTQHGRRNEATLNDARSIYRLCNTRPQRLLPTHGSTSGKSTGRLLAARRLNVKPLSSLYDGRRRLETSPFYSSASCDYYVFALRRLLC